MPLAVRKDIVRLRREQIEAERHVQHPTLSDVRNDSRSFADTSSANHPHVQARCGATIRYRWRPCWPIAWLDLLQLINLKKVIANSQEGAALNHYRRPRTSRVHRQNP
jgi:hypothetical protein